MPPQTISATPLPGVPNTWDRSGLPPWTYVNPEFHALEKEEIFKSHWQIVCHVSDVPGPGDYYTCDMAGERALILRDRDGTLRAFHNVCRHRGSRVIAAERGTCPGVITCPFHAWTYNLDGTLRAPARPDALPPLEAKKHGLKPLEFDIWHGFIFVRFRPTGGPGVAAVMHRFADEVTPYAMEDMVPDGNGTWNMETGVNWKSIRDVDNEGYHVARAHPGLNDLYGRDYMDEPFFAGAGRSVGVFNADPASLWSVRHYRRLLQHPDAPGLPRAWVYLAVFPNTVISLYPDSVNFYQEVPVAPTRSLVRGAVYRRREEPRALRLARYLSGRIDAITTREDQMLTIWSFEAMQSSGYDGIILSDLEYGLRSYHDCLRQILPVMTLETPPGPGTLRQVNDAMRARTPPPAVQ